MFTLEQGPEGEERYSSLLSLTSAVDVGRWSTPCPSYFTFGKETHYPLYNRLGGPHGLSGRVRKISTAPRFDPRIVQPVESRYTYYVCKLGLLLPAFISLNPSNAELNPICFLLALLVHHFLHVSRIRVKSVTLRLLMSYIYIYIWSTYS